MRAIDLHSEQREKEAKQALVVTAKRVVGKYIITQKVLNSLLSGGIVSGNKKKGGWRLVDGIDKLTRNLAKLEDQAGQIAKTYEMMFGVSLDLKAITKESFEQHYPVVAEGYKKAAKDKASEELGKGISFRKLDLDEVPEELRSLVESIKGGLDKIGGTNSIDVGVIEIGKDGTIFGLHPKDFESFQDFYKAVKKAGKKAGKEILTEEKLAALMDEGETTTNETVSSSSEDPDNGKDPKDPSSN